MPAVRLLQTGDVESLALCGMFIIAAVIYLAQLRWVAAVAFICTIFASSAAFVYEVDVLEGQRRFSVDAITGSPASLSRDLARLATSGITQVGYDTAAWHPFLLSTYELFQPNIHFVFFDSTTMTPPRTKAIIAEPRWRPDASYRAESREAAGGAILWIKTPTVRKRTPDLTRRNLPLPVVFRPSVACCWS